MATFTLEPLVPRYSYLLPFEKNFDPAVWQEWMSDNWHVSILFSVLYLAIVCWYNNKKEVPVSRTPFKEFRSEMFIWNLCVSIFSIVGALRTFPELLHSMNFFGFHHTVCDADYMVTDPVSGFWTFASVVSKALMLGNTYFLILRGRPVLLIHSFHHSSVLVAGWFLYSHKMAAVRWFVFMDFCINSLLYTYFTLRSVCNNVPKSVTFSITVVQILQMVPGTYFSLYAYLCWWYGEDCEVTGAPAHVSLILYVCYLILYLEFFHSVYLDRWKEDMKKQQ